MSTVSSRHLHAGLEAVQLIGNSAYGGAVPVVFGIMDVTAELGMKPVLLATHPEVVGAARSRGYAVWEFPGIVREPHPLRDFGVALRLAIALRRRGVRVLHTHTSKGGMVGRLAGRLAGCDVVLHHTHGFYHSGLAPGVKYRTMWGLEWLFARMDDFQVFVNTNEAREAADSGLVPAKKIRVVFNGVEDPRSSTRWNPSVVRTRWGVPPEAPLVGCVSRLDIEQKGLDIGLKTFALVLQEVPDARLMVVGAGDDRGTLEDMAASLNIEDRVIFTGHVDGAGSLHECFDVSFAPSRREGQSISVIEAMACSRPVVTTAIAGTMDLVEDGSTGVMCSVDDTEAMADAITGLLGDPRARERIGSAARLRYERLFTREAFVARVRTLYNEALTGVRT